MVRDYAKDRYNPTLDGLDAYGHNGPNALPLGITASFAELVVLLAILRPWSYQRSWGRALIALILFSPWKAINVLVSMHAGGVLALHTLWLFAIWMGLIGLAAISADNSIRHAAKSDRVEDA